MNTLPIYAIHYLFIGVLPNTLHEMAYIPNGFFFQLVISFVYAVFAIMLCLLVDRILSLNPITRPETIAQVPSTEELKNCIAIHVRMGDYSANWRIPIEWFKSIIENALKLNPQQKFLIFSDGTDEELAMLTALPNTERVFYGNAYADMIAISRCKMLIASDSTFSCWGAFLGRVPTLFYRRNFPSIFSGNVPEEIIGDSTDIPEVFKNIILDNK